MEINMCICRCMYIYSVLCLVVYYAGCHIFYFDAPIANGKTTVMFNGLECETRYTVRARVLFENDTQVGPCTFSYIETDDCPCKHYLKYCSYYSYNV